MTGSTYNAMICNTNYCNAYCTPGGNEGNPQRGMHSCYVTMNNLFVHVPLSLASIVGPRARKNLKTACSSWLVLDVPEKSMKKVSNECFYRPNYHLQFM